MHLWQGNVPWTRVNASILGSVLSTASTRHFGGHRSMPVLFWDIVKVRSWKPSRSVCVRLVHLVDAHVPREDSCPACGKRVFRVVGSHTPDGCLDNGPSTSSHLPRAVTYVAPAPAVTYGRRVRSTRGVCLSCSHRRICCASFHHLRPHSKVFGGAVAQTTIPPATIHLGQQRLLHARRQQLTVIS